MSEMKNETKRETAQAKWMQDPLLDHIEKYKLEFIQSLVFESSQLKQEQMLPFLMAVIKRSKAKKVTFSDSEMDALVTVLKKHASPGEMAKINQVLAMRKKS